MDTFKSTLLIIAIIGTSIIIVIIEKTESIITPLILFFTFLSICWYSYETYRMKEESVRQNEIEQKPILDLYFFTSKNIFRLRNSGKGVAYNIHIDPITIGKTTFKFYINQPNDILESLGDTKDLEVSAHIKQRNQKSSLISDSGAITLLKNTISPQKILSDKDLKDATFTIHYENALKRKYLRIFKLYCTTAATDDFKIHYIEEK